MLTEIGLEKAVLFEEASHVVVGVVIVWIYGLLGLVGLFLNIGMILRLVRNPVNWLKRTRWLQTRPWRGVDVARMAITLCVAFLVFFSLYSFVANRSGIWSDDRLETVGLFGQSIAFHGVALIAITIMVVRRRLSIRRAFGIRLASLGKDIVLGVLFYMAALPFLMAYFVIYGVWLQVTGREHIPQDVLYTFMLVDSPYAMAYFVFLAVCLAPLAEELLFRGVALPVLTKKVGLIPAIMALSLFFAAIHNNLSAFIPLFIIAVGFSLGYLYTRSIVTSITMHILFNGMNVGLLLLMRFV